MTIQGTKFHDVKIVNTSGETAGKRTSFASVMARALIPVICLLLAGGAAAEASEPVVKTLALEADPLEKAVLVGRVAADGMVLQLELEGSEPMWMLMGSPPVWNEHQPSAGERYHVEVKVTDPATKTRIPYAGITFAATLAETGKTMSMSLPPMLPHSHISHLHCVLISDSFGTSDLGGCYGDDFAGTVWGPSP